MGAIYYFDNDKLRGPLDETLTPIDKGFSDYIESLPTIQQEGLTGESRSLIEGIDFKFEYRNIPVHESGAVARGLMMVAVPLSSPPSPTPETGEKDEFKTAVEALEIMASKHNLHIDIKYRPKLYNVAQKKGWTIKTMQSMFNDKSFVEASRKACAFIYNAKGLNDEQPS